MNTRVNNSFQESVQGSEQPVLPELRRVWPGFLAIFVAVLGCVWAVQIQLPVDGHEYLCTVTSLMYTHNMQVEEEDLTRAAKMVSPETFFVAPRVEGGTREYGQNAKLDKHGKWVWGSHSYYVALLALPFVAVFGAKGFLVLNAVCLLAILILLYRHLYDLNVPFVSFWLACACVLCSGMLTYVFWINSEVLLMALVSGALYFGLRSRPILGMALLGLATAIKPPLLFLAVPLVVYQWWQVRGYRKPGFMLAAFVIAGLPQLVFYYHTFGTYYAPGAQPPPLTQEEGGICAGSVAPPEHDEKVKLSEAQVKAREERLQVRKEEMARQPRPQRPSRFRSVIHSLVSIPVLFEFVGWARTWAYWFAPGSGLIWFYPAIFWCLLRNRWPWPLFMGLVLTAVVVGITSMVPINLYSAGAGIRYATMIAPIFFFLGGRWKGSLLDWVAIVPIAFFGGALAMDATQGPRNFEQVYANISPSMGLVRDCGFTMYPELLYVSGCRWNRDVVFDYVDDQGYLRNDHVQMMVRNVAPGDLIVKLLADVDGVKAPVYFDTPSGRSVKTPITPGCVATAMVPVQREDLVSIAHPEYRFLNNQAVSTMTVRISLPEMGVREGEGGLRWQHRMHGRSMFMYKAGPRVLSVYPSREWILATLGSESLAENSLEGLGKSMAATEENVRLSLDTGDFMEGTHAVVIRNTPSSVAPVYVVSVDKVPLEGSLRMYGELEVAGWVKVDSVTAAKGGAARPSIKAVVNWFDKDGFYLERSAAWECGGAGSWKWVKDQVKVPRGARSFSFGFVFENAVAVVKLDDVVVSWFKNTWDPRH